jgi:hypothetical protein
MTLIASMLLMIYKKLNKIEGYKITKIRFAEELDKELLKIIVIACNGDPNKIDDINDFKGFVH